jgi:uncharacterized repeat protein (TIGR01451 family)
MHNKTLYFSFSLFLALLTLAGVLCLMWMMSESLRVAQARPIDRAHPSDHIAATDVTTRYVSSVSGDDAGDCTDDAAPCETIQYAVDGADDGDTVLIATRDNTTEATYTGSGENVVALDKSLTLHGGYLYVHTTPPVSAWTRGVQPSTVDGQDQRRAIHVSGDVTVTLRMLALVNGQATQGGDVYAEDARVRFVATPILSGTADYGGGLYLKNCRTAFDLGDLSGDFGFELDDGLLEQLGVSGLLLVQGNTAQYGGGIYVEGGRPALAGLAVTSNTATVDGGGLYLQGGGPVFAGGLVMDNQAGNRGGGLFLEESAARIAGTAVYSNTAVDGAGFYLDGPIAFSELTVPIIANNYVRYNRTTSSLGGGFYFHKAVAGLVNNVIADNAADEGAGMYLYASSPQLFHTTLAQNAGASGVYVTYQPGQVWPPVAPFPSLPSFTNTIIVSHTVGLHVDSTGMPSPLENEVTLDGTLWWGNDDHATGAGEVVQNTDVYSRPRFRCIGGLPQCVLPYHVLTDSAAVDAGVVVGLSIPGTDLLVDIDGQMRPANQAYDIGADEVVTRAFDVWFMPPSSQRLADPGQVVTHVHRLMNTGLQTDTYDLTLLSGEEWAELLGQRAITLTPRASETVQLRVTVPETATDRLQEVSIITATSRGGAGRRSRALDVTRVFTGDRADVQVDKWADVETVESGEAVRFTLVVTNAGPLTGTLGVTLTDSVVPTQAIAGIEAPTGLCTSDADLGLVTCTLTLEGATLPVTSVLNVVVTTTETYTDVLINTALARSAARDDAPQNNGAEATVGVGTPPCVPLEEVTIEAPAQVYSGTAATFTANISPSMATSPTVYVWRPQPDGSAILPGRSVATYTWPTTGTQVITVTAANCGGEGYATNSYTVTVRVEEKHIYLPVVMRNA